MEKKKYVSISVIKLRIAPLVTCYLISLRVAICIGMKQREEEADIGTPASTQREEMVPLAHQALAAFSLGSAKMSAWTQRFAKTLRVVCFITKVYIVLC